MDSTSEKRFHKFFRQMKNTAKQHPRLFVFYLLLRFAVVAIMIEQFFNNDYKNVLLCLLTLLLFSIPTFVERRIKVDVPDTLEVIILLFIFSADILGEIREYYVSVPGWDTMLHTINGFLSAAIGVALIDILNRNDKFSIHMAPIFVAISAFCFSMTIGVLWEFFEYFADLLLRTDMQKDAVIQSISSVLIHPEGRNIPVIVEDITKTVITSSSHGDIIINGYLDIGLLDTMKDLIVNFIGALTFSVIGFFYVKYRKAGKHSKFVSRFILTKITVCDNDVSSTVYSIDSFDFQDDESNDDSSEKISD